jgi:hypothetical protein
MARADFLPLLIVRPEYRRESMFSAKLLSMWRILDRRTPEFEV